MTKKPPHKGWYCKDCNKNTFESSEVDYYMLTHELWDRIGVGDGMLCIACVEERLGRKLKAEDLLDCPLNDSMNEYTQKILKS